MVRLEKAGIDVVPRLITLPLNSENPLANINFKTFANDDDAKMAF